MKKLFILLLALSLASCTSKGRKDLASYVDPFIGTGGHGHTFPGATMPFGMVQLSPDTRINSWDGCSGYHYSDSTIIGFSHTHLSGTGAADYGDIRFMPTTGILKNQPGDENNPDSGYRSRFRHETEEATPGYYKVVLDDYKITAEFTVTDRCGFHKYTFPASDSSHIMIDLTESITSDEILGLKIEILDDHTIAGSRRTNGWADDQGIYFYAVFSKPFRDYGISVDGKLQPGLSLAEGKDLKAYINYNTSDKETIMAKVGISAVSIDGARNNLETEIHDWNFSRIARNAKKDWNKELDCIEVEGGNPGNTVIFYTALYHAMIAPNLFSDVDGKYYGHDRKIHTAEGRKMYTVFSLWDTYRTLHPLMTIIQPQRTKDFIASILDIYEKGGLLPVWELAGNETFCMIGYHAVPVIVDAYVKGYRDFNLQEALEAMIHSATQDHFGLSWYRKYGYIPADQEGESVSKTLEYAYDDWCIATMANLMGEEDIYEEYIERAQYYKNLFDPETGFFRGKRNGMFVSPFDPAEVNFMLTEANTWQYTFYVPQDVSGLISLMGGDEAFCQKLDQLFASSSALSGREQVDISGLIGQYAHGNEPSHHMAYLYNYSGKAYKTQKLVRQIMDELYGEGTDGLCGNEDCGQMSAWYVMSAMGFYPVTPGTDEYVIGSPLFERIRINLDNGRHFIIKAHDNSDSRVYINEARLNGEAYQQSFIHHQDIINGGDLEFNMSPRPNYEWGSDMSERPESAIDEHLIVAVPFFGAKSNTFRENIEVGMGHIDTGATLYYHLNRQAPRVVKYTDSIFLSKTTELEAWAQEEDIGRSKNVDARFYKLHHDWDVTIKNPYSSQYSAGGAMALIDGQRGSLNFRTGYWQGYQGVNFEATIDLGRSVFINKIAVDFLEDQNSWIFMPREVEIQVSRKPYDFKTLSMINYSGPERTDKPLIHTFEKDNLNTRARYVKVKARNIGVCPDWHRGAGNKAWMFVDEISIK